MPVNIHHLIAAISPETYCNRLVKDEVKRVIREKGTLHAAELAKPVEERYVDFEQIELMNAVHAPGLEVPSEKHRITLDAPEESMEMIFLWIYEEMRHLFPHVEKIRDDFLSPRIADIGARAAKVQVEAMRMFKDMERSIKMIEDSVRLLKDLKSELMYSEDENRYSEVKKDFEKERANLRRNLGLVKSSARSVIPYLRAAKLIERVDSAEAAFVSAFNTALLNLVLIGKSEYRPEEDVKRGGLPKIFGKVKERKYFSTNIVELRFRGIQTRAGAKWVFSGKLEVEFTSYGLNIDEIDMLKKSLGWLELFEVMHAIEDISLEHFSEFQRDIDGLLLEKVSEYGKKRVDRSSPLKAFFSFIFPWIKKSEIFPGEIPPDNYLEKIIRSQSIIEAQKRCRDLWESFKRAFQMLVIQPV